MRFMLVGSCPTEDPAKDRVSIFQMLFISHIIYLYFTPHLAYIVQSVQLIFRSDAQNNPSLILDKYFLPKGDIQIHLQKNFLIQESTSGTYITCLSILIQHDVTTRSFYITLVVFSSRFQFSLCHDVTEQSNPINLRFTDPFSSTSKC